ncbi:FapA family protein [Isachenkonia alkalipeptolytica]|uniref:DUF342 domain-containing protein n=1 Tax=Isachenkonia alkalipeptolytica TaxID=2565777 RepID=A0AA43XK00_9CLOT|nr:FapA family protein [Isachenkonia alkalipeptolytica]NBG87594.1 DUF342 domain-containing protein [Isachenkonia alkalipeptolytica]
MKASVTITENHYDMALEKALTELQASKEEVDIELLEEKKGLFTKKTVTIKVSKKNEPIEKNLERSKELQEKGMEKINGGTPDETTGFVLSYEEDGVYATLKNRETLGSDKKELITYLSQKKVQDVDSKTLFEIDETTLGEPVKIAPAQEEVLIDSEVEITLRNEGLEANITLTKPYGGKVPTVEEVMDKLHQEKIVYGIDREQIEKILAHRVFDKPFQIAGGDRPKKGKDGEIRYLVDVEAKAKPKISDSGTINFKELNIINNVEVGTALAELIPPGEGRPGKNIFGEEIPPEKGREARLPKGKNTEISEDERFLHASQAGQVQLIDGKVEVKKVYEVPANVDNSTGNIAFKGKVLVRGNVKAGFNIDAEEDIEVQGVVEGSELKAGGDIILNRGVQGNNQAVLTGENIIAKYIENATLKAKGNIEAEAILHSIVQAKGSITVGGKKGLIVGGSIKAQKEIRAKVMGSHMGTITNVEVGLDPEDKEYFDALEKTLEEIDKNILNLNKTIELLKKLEGMGKLTEDKETMLIKSLKTMEFLNNKKVNSEKEIESLRFKIANANMGKVSVSSTIYPGVKVRILNGVRHIYEEMSNATLYRKEGDVVIGPYEK